MTLEESYKKYKISPEILKDYKDSPKYIDFNLDDQDLDTIRVELPKTPEWNTIDGFGLKAKDQFFKRIVMPDKIIELQDRQDEEGNFLMQDEIWAVIEEERDYYQDVLDFIKLQWQRRLYGYWFFNNGVATYLDGWHYFFLNFYKIDEGAPEYRDRDRRFFIFAKYIKNDDKFYGFIYPKHRREGATYKTSSIHYEIVSRSGNAIGGIQSMTDKSGKDVYIKHIVNPWKSMPFFFKPNNNGGDDPQASLKFRGSSSRGKKGIRRKGKKELLSEIEFRPSGEKAFDGTKLLFYHHEEIGKTENVNIVTRWSIVKPCLATGAGRRIKGFSIHTSTVGEMEKGGGDNFLKLCNGSMYGKRNANGQTQTGLCILFIPAYDGLEGFIDKYGMSVMDKPTPEQAEFIGVDIGAKQFIQNTIDGYRSRIDEDGVKDELSDFIRQHPLTYRGCFRYGSKDSFFDIDKIEDRLEELRYAKDLITKGNFEWTGAKYLSPVKFVPDPDGRFTISKLMGDRANKCAWDSNARTWVAENLEMCAGADPFKNDKTSTEKKSMFGGAVYWGRDLRADPMDKPIDEWESSRFVCSYNCRPNTKEDGCEDMMMMCMYFGCPMFPEVDVATVREEFERHHFGGMLVHEFVKNDYKDLAGVTAARYKQKIFNLYRTQVKRHAHRECHADVLEQCRDIRGEDEFTKYDLFAAGGYAMAGIDNYLPELQEQATTQNTDEHIIFVEEFDI